MGFRLLPIQRKSATVWEFDWFGTKIEVRARLRANGEIASGVDFYAGGQLVYGTAQECGTLGDAIEAFALWQASLEPGPVYPEDEQAVGQRAQAEVGRMQARDPMAGAGRIGLRQ